MLTKELDLSTMYHILFFKGQMMLIQELGKAVRDARSARGLTQAELARAAGLSRNTLNRLENGLFPDLGIKKVEALLEKLDMEIDIKTAEPNTHKPDYVSMASQSASVSFKNSLEPEELVNALLSGKPPVSKHAHMIAVLEESSSALFNGLLEQVSPWTKPGKVEKNLQKIAKEVGLVEGSTVWKKAA
jgi:transcriptional regulator with XRE-family HTH domain